ncbi:hypothetical protein GQ457_16G021600 [Hibiscus cannabinus]
MSMSHNATVDKPRLVLIHAILTSIKFNVGQVIARELSDACKKKSHLSIPLPDLCSMPSGNNSNPSKRQVYT